MEFVTESIDTVDDTDEELVVLVKWFEVCEARLEQAEEDLAAAKNALIAGLDERGEKSKTVGEDGMAWKITAVQGSRAVVNEVGLIKSIGKRAFNKYTVRKLDVKGIEKAVQEGTLELDSISPYIEYVATQTYPKVTRGSMEVVYK